MSMSLEDFFNTDSFYIAYILQKEKELIDYENKEMEKLEKQSNNSNKSGSQIPLKQDDTPNAIMAYEAYFED